VYTLEIESLLYFIYNNFKWIKDLKRDTETIKFLEENIEGKLHDIGFANDFLDMIPKA
jgi:hypothetical protein